MNQRIKHTEPITNSYAAAYGYRCMYEDFIDQAVLSKTLYTSPYTCAELSRSMIVTGREYTKHYYIESQRVTTKLGGGMANNLVNPISGTLTAIEGDVNQISMYLWENLLQTQCTDNIEIEIEPMFPNIDELMQQDHDEGNLYFYHGDHLGSSSWITDASGDVNQHLQYLPFGESFIDQRTNHDIRFKFTTKEEDSETGYQYFGARYYASGLSVWLSVDPLAGKYPSMSPYMYCAGNPVMLVDPTGMIIDPAGEKEATAYTNYKTEVSNQVDAYDNKTTELRNRGTRSGNRRADRRKKNRHSIDYVKIQSELEQLEGAEEVYKIRMGENITSSAGGGNTRYNSETGEIDININEDGDFSEMQKMAHELKHAYQYHNGQLDFVLNGSKSSIGPLYDQIDEIEAFDRQNLFSGPKVNSREFVQNASNYRDLPQSSQSIYNLSPLGRANLKSFVKLKMRVISPNALRKL